MIFETLILVDLPIHSNMAQNLEREKSQRKSRGKENLEKQNLEEVKIPKSSASIELAPCDANMKLTLITIPFSGGDSRDPNSDNSKMSMLVSSGVSRNFWALGKGCLRSKNLLGVAVGTTFSKRSAGKKRFSKISIGQLPICPSPGYANACQ
jgi:hypothetical protein